MAALRARLVQLGDLEKSALATQQGDSFDAVTSMALVRFQVRHRLDIDGALGRATLDALNVPLARRVRQIEFALERSRWLPSRLASPPIIVNIPQFELFAFRTTEDRERDILIMDVVVGKVFPQNNTPVFVSDMRQVVLRPYWDVPRSILLDELLPQIKANPDWVANSGFEIVRGQGDDGTVVPQSAESVAALESGHAAAAAETGAAQCARQREVPVPEPLQRLSTRHAVARRVRAIAARGQPRLRAGRRPAGARTPRVAPQSRVDRGAHRGGDERAKPARASRSRSRFVSS